MEGRPDGQRPHGMESALAYHLTRLARAKAVKKRPFSLTSEQCSELFEEGVLYYYRYLHLFQIEEWERTVRDTKHNLRLFDLVQRYAERDEDREHLEQWRPYLVRMHATAAAMMRLKKQDYEGALRIVNDASGQIGSIPEMEDPTFKFERRRSLLALQEMASQIEKTRPLREVDVLERELRTAVVTEDFEQAADLRDRIRALKGGDEPPPRAR
jgi:hypothetical protein